MSRQDPLSTEAEVILKEVIDLVPPGPRRDGALSALGALLEASPEDIRAEGWSVAVHNDYRLEGEPHTFWLFTKEGRALKGEGRTDAEALAQVREQLYGEMRPLGIIQEERWTKVR